MEERSITAQDILREIEEYKKRKESFIKETLSAVLNSWKEEANTKGRTAWTLDATKQDTIELFKLNQTEFSYVFLEHYIDRLQELGFSIEKICVPATKTGWWIFSKTLTEAHDMYFVKL